MGGRAGERKEGAGEEGRRGWGKRLAGEGSAGSGWGPRPLPARGLSGASQMRHPLEERDWKPGPLAGASLALGEGSRVGDLQPINRPA